jgi:hypothetical protein
MKILIVAQSRSGSSSLQECIASSLGSPYIREPFSEWRPDVEADIFNIENHKDIVVKVVDSAFHNHHAFKDENDVFKMFDKIIGLTRDSTYQTVSSALIALHFNSWHESSKTKVSSIKEYQEIMGREFDAVYQQVEAYKIKIRSFDIFQTTYEELYVEGSGWEKLEEYLGIRLDREIVFVDDFGLKNKKY